MKRFSRLFWNYKIRSWLLLLSLVFFVAACTVNRMVSEDEYSDRGVYMNHVNSDLVRNQIQDAFESVVRIQNNVIYRTYQFYIDDMPFRSELSGADLEDVSAQSYLDDQSTAGTAIVISDFRGQYALLTASHTVFYPDTIWHYHNASSNTENPQVEAVSVRQSVNHFVLMEGGIIRLNLAVNDSNRDLAVMTNTNSNAGNLLTPLSLPMGNSDELGWGDLVYALGYPKGAKMVTLGTASRSDHPTRSILIDASFNRGFSGGALFALRNDGTGLEFMGLVTSALGESETYLVPEMGDREDFDPDVPYGGEVFVRSTPRINYGITNAVAVNEIREFFEENEDRLNDQGMVLP